MSLARARGARSWHVHSTRPGELVSLDTFYIGKLERVGQGLADDRLRCGVAVAWLLSQALAGWEPATLEGGQERAQDFQTFLPFREIANLDTWFPPIGLPSEEASSYSRLHGVADRW